MIRRGLFTGVAAAALATAVGCGSSSSAATALQTCRPGQFRPTLVLNGVTGGIVGVVKVQHVRGPACRLATVVRAAVRRKNGTLVEPIAGNPGASPLRGRLGRGRSLAVSWVWRNWCGPEQQFVLTASAGRARARHAVPVPPRCDESASESTFERFRS